MEYRTPHQEFLKCTRNNLIYLPYKEISYPNIPILFAELFNPDLYMQNMGIFGLVTEYYKLVGNDGYKGHKRSAYPLLSIDPRNAISAIQRIREAKHSKQTFETAVDHVETAELSINEVESKLSSGLDGISGKACVLTPSHLTDHFLIENMKERGVDLAEVGIIVIDQHIDGGMEQYRPDGFRPDKSNFLISILENGIGAISIMGINENDNAVIKDGALPGYHSEDGQHSESLTELNASIASLHGFYQKFADRLHLAEGVLGDTRSMNKPRKVLESLHRQIEYMKSRGVKRVMISFDLDSLNLLKEGITATPYSPYTRIVQMGLQDFTKILDAANVSEADLEKDMKAMIQLKKELDVFKVRQGKKMLSLREKSLELIKRREFYEFILKVSPVISKIDDSIQSFGYVADIPGFEGRFMKSFEGAHTISSEEGGLLLDQAEFLIGAIKQTAGELGLEVGVPVSNGTIIGSVSELDGPDVGGVSARAAIRIANALMA